jgi:hypothetical protein
MFLDTLVRQFELCNSIAVRRFLDPDRHTINYSGFIRTYQSNKHERSIYIVVDLALQHVSMFIRSTNGNYQIIEQLPDLGSTVLFCL